MVKTFSLTFYMMTKWAKSRSIQITTIFKFLNFVVFFTQSKAHLSDGIDRECIFKILASNSLPISEQAFLHMNTDSIVNSTFLILLALNTRISYEWLFQNLQTKYASKSVRWNLSDGTWTHEHSAFINPSNSAFLSKYIIEVVLKKKMLNH